MPHPLSRQTATSEQGEMHDEHSRFPALGKFLVLWLPDADDVHEVHGQRSIWRCGSNPD